MPFTGCIGEKKIMKIYYSDVWPKSISPWSLCWLHNWNSLSRKKLPQLVSDWYESLRNALLDSQLFGVKTQALTCVWFLNVRWEIVLIFVRAGKFVQINSTGQKNGSCYELYFFWHFCLWGIISRNSGVNSLSGWKCWHSVDSLVCIWVVILNTVCLTYSVRLHTADTALKLCTYTRAHSPNVWRGSGPSWFLMGWWFSARH